MSQDQVELYNLPEDFTFLISQKALIIEAGKLLVVKSIDFNHDDKAGWGLPGGLIDPYEQLHDGLKREVREEIGLEIEVGELVNCGTWICADFILKDERRLDVQVIQLGYLCDRRSEQITLGAEHTDYLWVDQNQLRKKKISHSSEYAINWYLNNREI